MRIHSDTLREQDIRDAVAVIPGVGIQALSLHGSRTRDHAFELALSGSSKFGGQYGQTDYKAGTWDEWGIVLAALFARDPGMVIPRVYESADHFHWTTGDRYRGLSVDDQHLRHNWRSGDVSGRSAGGTYYVQSCKCGAILRRLAPGCTLDTQP